MAADTNDSGFYIPSGKSPVAISVLKGYSSFNLTEVGIKTSNYAAVCYAENFTWDQTKVYAVTIYNKKSERNRRYLDKKSKNNR